MYGVVISTQILTFCDRNIFRYQKRYFFFVSFLLCHFFTILPTLERFAGVSKTIATIAIKIATIAIKIATIAIKIATIAIKIAMIAIKIAMIYWLRKWLQSWLQIVTNLNMGTKCPYLNSRCLWKKSFQQLFFTNRKSRNRPMVRDTTRAVKSHSPKPTRD